ncbi:MAG TPA: hypothetical protein PLQ36_00060 [Candidatus Gracilibacteria bacterium]|nr:hypothetical protein [Candidatus Gracilibacteria bacterium]
MTDSKNKDLVLSKPENSVIEWRDFSEDLEITKSLFSSNPHITLDQLSNVESVVSIFISRLMQTEKSKQNAFIDSFIDFLADEYPNNLDLIYKVLYTKLVSNLQINKGQAQVDLVEPYFFSTNGIKLSTAIAVKRMKNAAHKALEIYQERLLLEKKENEVVADLIENLKTDFTKLLAGSSQLDEKDLILSKISKIEKYFNEDKKTDLSHEDIVDLKNQQELLFKRLGEKEQEIQYLHKDNNRLLSENSSLENILKILNSHPRSVIEKKLNRVIKHNLELTKNLNLFNKENDQLKTELEDQKKSYQMLLNQHDLLKKEHKILRETNRQTSNHKAILLEENNKLKLDNENFRRKNAKLKDHNQFLEKEIATKKKNIFMRILKLVF